MLTLNPKIHTTPLSAGKPSFGRAKSRERALIMDDFDGFEPETASDINDDGIPELWHGYKVKAAFWCVGSHKDLPEIEEKQEKYEIFNTNKTIKEIIKRNNDNNPNNDIDIVNNSTYLRFNFEQTSDDTGIKITPENIYETKDEIIPILNDDYLSGKKLLEKLTKKVKFYTIADNKGTSFFNFFSLADGVKTIGGLDEQGKHHPDSGKNSLIGKNDWAPFEFYGSLIDKDGKPVFYDTDEKIQEYCNEPVGYDVAPLGQEGDGEPDILLSDIKLSGDNSPYEWIAFEGTSYSAPYKAGKDALARQKGQKEWSPAELYGEDWESPSAEFKNGGLS